MSDLFSSRVRSGALATVLLDREILLVVAEGEFSKLLRRRLNGFISVCSDAIEDSRRMELRRVSGGVSSAWFLRDGIVYRLMVLL